MVGSASRDCNAFISISTQQITKLIKYEVATGVTPTYDTNNTSNERLSRQFTCTVPCNETADASTFYFSSIPSCYQYVPTSHPFVHTKLTKRYPPYFYI